MPDAKDFLRAVKYLAKGVVGESGHFSDEMLQQIGKVIQDNPNDLKNLPDLIKEDLEKAGHKLSDEAIDFLEKGNFRLFKDPKKLEALSNFGVKLSTAFDGADELADDFVKTELDTLAKELAIGSGVKDKWFGPLEKQYTELFNGREKVIDRLWEKNLADNSINPADARKLACGQYADAMASAKETLNARKGINADDVAKTGDNVATAGSKTSVDVGNDVANKGPTAHPDFGKGSTLGNQKGFVSIDALTYPIRAAFNTVAKPFKKGVKNVKEEVEYLSKIVPDKADERFETLREMGWHQRTIGGVMNVTASALESYATVRGMIPFSNWSSHDSPWKTIPNWLNAGEKFIKHRVESFDKVLAKINPDTGTSAFHSFAQLESNMHKAITAIGGDKKEFEFFVDGHTHTIKTGEVFKPASKEIVDGKEVIKEAVIFDGVTKDNVDEVLKRIRDTHQTSPTFKDNLTDVKKHLADWKDYVENRMFVTGTGKTKYTWRKGCTNEMKKNELLSIRKLSDTVEGMLGNPKGDDDFIKQIQDQMKEMRKAGKSDIKVRETLEQMTISTVGEFAEQHKVRSEGFYLARNPDGSFDGVDTLNFTLGREEDNYLKRFGFFKEIEQNAVLEKADTTAPGDFSRANAGKMIGIANQFEQYVKDGTFTEWSSAGQNNLPGQFDKFYEYGRPGRIVANQILEYLSLARGAKDFDTTTTNFKTVLKGMAEKAEDPNHATFLKNMAKQSELVGDGGATGDARDIWAKFAAPFAQHRIADITERQVISFRSEPLKWLTRWGGQSGPAADNLWVMARNKLWDTTLWAVGGEKSGKGPALTMGRTWGKEFAGFEVEGKWRALNTLHSVTTRPAVTNMLHALRPSTVAFEFPFRVSMSNMYQLGGVTAGLTTALSLVKYGIAPDENEEKGGLYFAKLVGNAAHKTLWGPATAVSLYGNFHNLVFDKGAGYVIRDCDLLGNNKDLSEFWRHSRFRVEGEGGLVPAKQIWDKVVMNLGQGALTEKLDRMHLNEETRTRQDKIEAKEKTQDLLNFAKKKGLLSSDTSGGSSSKSSIFNRVNGKPQSDESEPETSKKRNDSVLDRIMNKRLDTKSEPVKTQLTGKFDDTGSLETADPNTQFVDMMKDTTTTSGDEEPSQDYFMLNTLLSVK